MTLLAEERRMSGAVFHSPFTFSARWARKGGSETAHKFCMYAEHQGLKLLVAPGRTSSRNHLVEHTDETARRRRQGGRGRDR